MTADIDVPTRDGAAPREGVRGRQADATAGREWFVVAVVAAALLLILTVLSYNIGRGTEEGLVAGIAWRYLQGVVLTMVIFALFTLGLNLEFGFTGLINFGHVLFLGIGAYTAAVLTWRLGPGWEDAGLVLAVGAAALIVAVSAALAVVAAVVLGVPSLRLREDYLAITTIGAAEVMRLVWLNEQWLTNGSNGLSVRMPGAAALRDPEGPWARLVSVLQGAGIDVEPYLAFVTLVAAAALAAAYWLVQRLTGSPWGRVVRAIRENEDVAASLGKPVFRVKLESLAVGSVIAAVAGVLFAWFQRFITPQAFLPIVTFYAWIILVVGGTGNHRGVLAGSVILWGLFEGARQLPALEALGIGRAAGPQQVLFIGVMLVLIMLFRPQGALGNKEELRLG